MNKQRTFLKPRLVSSFLKTFKFNALRPQNRCKLPPGTSNFIF